MKLRNEEDWGIRDLQEVTFIEGGSGGVSPDWDI